MIFQVLVKRFTSNLEDEFKELEQNILERRVLVSVLNQISTQTEFRSVYRRRKEN